MAAWPPCKWATYPCDRGVSASHLRFPSLGFTDQAEETRARTSHEHTVLGPRHIEDRYRIRNSNSCRVLHDALVGKNDTALSESREPNDPAFALLNAMLYIRDGRGDYDDGDGDGDVGSRGHRGDHDVDDRPR